MPRNTIQRRINPASRGALQFREAAGDAPARIGGYAAVFYNGQAGTEYRVGSWWAERIMPGAFDRAIAEAHDVRCLFNHSDDFVLGRTASGTCRLSIDATGLAFETDIDPDDAQARSVLAKIRRGDVDGASFQFIAVREEVDKSGDVPVFLIRDVDLFDVAPVTWPAYEAASVESRSDDPRADLAERIRRAERGQFSPLPRSLVLAQARIVEIESR